MRVLLGQLDPVPGDPEANAASVAEALRAHPEVDLAAFPELFLSGYDADHVHERAITPDHPALVSIREAARQHGASVVVGFAERVGLRVANAVACIDAGGGWTATYRKTRLFGPEERRVFVPGDHLTLAELGGRRVAPLICFDVEFPEPARALTQAGADLLVTVAANMAPYGPDHALAARARALDNRRPHLYVNRVGSESGLRFVGGSMAIRADGSVATVLGDEAEVVCVELASREAIDEPVDYLSQLRADLRVETSFRPTNGGTA